MDVKKFEEHIGQLRIKVQLEDMKDSSGPLTKLTICGLFGISLVQYEKLRTKAINNKRWQRAFELLDEIVLNSFYKYSFDKKINQGIQLYQENEIRKTNAGVKLEVFVDINDYQKQLQPFDINNPNRLDIENTDDEITIIEDSLDEIGMEIAEGQHG